MQNNVMCFEDYIYCVIIVRSLAYNKVINSGILIIQIYVIIAMCFLSYISSLNLQDLNGSLIRWVNIQE